MTDLAALPYISIVIPARNEEEHLRACLESVRALDYPGSRYEVIVVDNGSTDETVSIARSFGVKVLERPGIKVGAVRNAGCRAAVGEILAFTDADCILPQGWLEAARAHLEKATVGAVGGLCTVPEDSTWIERCWVTPQSADVTAVTRLAGSSFIVKRGVFEGCRGFDENIVAGEDDKLSDCIARDGLSLLSLKECAVTHLGYPKSLMSVLKRQMWHAKSSYQIKNGFLDRTFVATNLYLFSLILMLLAAFTSYFSWGLWLALPCILFVTSMHPIRKVSSTFPIYGLAGSCVRFMQLYVVYGFYFVGRSLGLALNYRDMVWPRRIKQC